MDYTINLDDECISAEELRLMETKQSILKKLEVRFGNYMAHDSWKAAHSSVAKELSGKYAHRQRK
jgi:hypothetical protein